MGVNMFRPALPRAHFAPPLYSRGYPLLLCPDRLNFDKLPIYFYATVEFHPKG